MDRKTGKRLYEMIIITLHSIQTGESPAPEKQQGLTSQEFDP